MGDVPSPSVRLNKDDSPLRAGILGDPRIKRRGRLYSPLLESVPCSSKRTGVNGDGFVQGPREFGGPRVAPKFG